VFEVNADLLRNALRITPKDLDHPFTLPALEKEIISFINELGCSKKATAYDRPRLTMLQLLWEWFTKLIIKYILSQNNQVSKRPLSFQHVIKLDATLGNLKFIIKGQLDLIFGMPIPDIMLSNEIKASEDYQKYMAKVLEAHEPSSAKSGGTGKRLITKKDLADVLKKVNIPKKIRSETMFEESVDYEQVDNEADSKETDEEDEISFIRKQPGISIGSRPCRESNEGNDDQSKKGGIELLSKVAQYDRDRKKAQKASRYDFNIKLRPLRLSSSISDYELAVKDISNDDDDDNLADDKNADANAVDEQPQRRACQNHPSFDDADLEEFDQKDKLFKMMTRSKSYKKHPDHRALLDSLVKSLVRDEDDMDRQKDKDQVGSSKKGKSPSKPSNNDKLVTEEDTIHDIEMDAGKSVENEVINVDIPKQAYVSGPNPDISNWFKQSPRPETPDHDWHKEPTANDAPKQPWFNEIVNTQKDSNTHDDNLEGDRIPQDFSKPLQLQGAPGRLTIIVDLFFNKDLEYLTTKNLGERKYATSLTKPKSASHWGLQQKLFYKSKQAAQSNHHVYSRLRILSIVRIYVDKRFGYGYLKEIILKRGNQK
ncbi:hypothetical protein Tco_1208837, partial [Tanacetum coccineum]